MCHVQGAKTITKEKRTTHHLSYHATLFLVPWWSHLAGNVMATESWRIALVVWVFVAKRNLLRDSWLVAATWQVGATVQEKFKVRPCSVKTQGLALIGCACQLPCWRHCFVSADFSPGWKPKIYDRATTVLVHYSLLGGVAFWRCWTFGAVLVVLVLLLQGIYHCSRAFSFSVILLLFLVVCIRIATRALRCCRGWM
jgi:hypothetical protein